MKCPECQLEIGKKAGIDIYKHAVACLHLADKGAKELLEEFEGDDTPRGQRVRILLNAAMKGE